MGRSRRERVVTLTKTRKHVVGLEKKQEFVQKIRDFIDAYAHFYVFSTENMRNALLKDLRASWKDSQFYFGRKRVIQVALGRNVEEEYLENLHKISEHLEGNVGLLFTNRSHEDVLHFFDTYAEDEFARSGFVATRKVDIENGPLDRFEPNQIQNLRLVGLPVDLKKGVVTLSKDFTVCEEGETLTPEKAKILEFMDIRMAKFRVILRCHYSKKDSSFETLSNDEAIEEDSG